ncbi:MAG: hypothetical protein OXT67_10785 [Zetaproteobacteria bacterium]|nr:hypothetical protein [Zetaproteobacteria bacterium]
MIRTFIFVIIATWFSCLIPAQASILIKDNRFRTHQLHGKMGFGYAMMTNTMHGLCLEDMEGFPKSSHLKYEFLNIQPGYKTTLWGLPREDRQQLLQFLHDNVVFTRQGKLLEPTFAANKQHNLLVLLSLESHSHALQMSGLRIHNAHKHFLAEQDYHSFFSHCGSHFVSALSQVSYMAALISFRGVNTHSDLWFMAQLTAAIKKFHPGGASPTLSKEMQQRETQITFHVAGLSKQAEDLPQRAALDNIEELREQLNTAVTGLHQAPLGIAHTVELTPWTELADFATTFHDHHETTKTYRPLATLQKNAEIVTKIHEVDTRFTKLENLSIACHDFLREYHPVGRPPFGQDPKTTLFQHHRYPGERRYALTLEKLWNYFEQGKISERITKQRDYFFAGNSGKEGINANLCLASLRKGGYTQQPYTSIAACQQVKRYRFPRFPYVSGYCMPKRI